MPMNRRELLRAAAGLPFAQTALAAHAFAQAAYPTRNITMIVPFPAGGQADLAARPVALALERILGKPVIVDNRAGGAGGSIGNAQAARAEPDGYTLLMTLSSLAVLPGRTGCSTARWPTRSRNSRRSRACSPIPRCSRCRPRRPGRR
jgi:tripartite-type tricarboxylate transporter receptor subunit TctC